MVFSDDPLIESVRRLMAAFDEKAEEFKSVLKVGRTQLQDAGTKLFFFLKRHCGCCCGCTYAFIFNGFLS